MTPLEVLRAIEAAGVVLRADVDRLKGSPPEAVAALDPEVRSALDEHRGRILAALRLRGIHRRMGLSEEDVEFVETAILSGQMAEVRLVVRAPELVA